MSGLTDFKWQILHILYGEPKIGIEVKRQLEMYYREEVNHGRVYPNLDGLVEDGFVEKGEYDKRTNRYSLTEKGEEKVKEKLRWELENFVTNERRRKEVEDLLNSIPDDDILQH